MTLALQSLSELLASEVLVHSNIGMMLQQRGDFLEAMDHYSESLRLRSVRLSECDCERPQHQELAEDYRNIAQRHLVDLVEQYKALQQDGKVLDRSGEGQKVGLHFYADPYLVNTEASQEEYELSLGSTLFNMSLIHHWVGSLGRAGKLLNMALDAVEDTDSFTQPLIVGIILNNMACVQFEEGRYDAAMETFTEVYLLLQQKEHEDTIVCRMDQRINLLGNVMVNMAWTCIKLGDNDDANSLCGQIQDLLAEEANNNQSLQAIKSIIQQQDTTPSRQTKPEDKHWLALYRDDEFLRTSPNSVGLSEEEIGSIQDVSKQTSDSIQNGDKTAFRSSFSSRKIVRVSRVE